MKPMIGIGSGSNLGDRAGYISQAREEIGKFVSELRCSTIYETIAFPDPTGPPYLNAVAVGQTDLLPRQLLALFKGVEHGLGRQQVIIK